MMPPLPDQYPLAVAARQALTTVLEQIQPTRVWQRDRDTQRRRFAIGKRHGAQLLAVVQTLVQFYQRQLHYRVAIEAFIHASYAQDGQTVQFPQTDALIAQNPDLRRWQDQLALFAGWFQAGAVHDQSRYEQIISVVTEIATTTAAHALSVDADVQRYGDPCRAMLALVDAALVESTSQATVQAEGR